MPGTMFDVPAVTLGILGPQLGVNLRLMPLQLPTEELSPEVWEKTFADSVKDAR